MEELNGYNLSRNFFDWCFENPEKISPNHSAIYFFAIEHCNRLGWKKKFGFPTQMAMDALGIKKHETYIRYFNDLVEWGFLTLIQKSRNQYSANIISINSAIPKNGGALGKATRTHAGKQTDSKGESTGESNSSILKQDNIEPLTKETIKTCFSFDDFWNMYDKKIDSKKCKAKYEKLTEAQRAKIRETLPAYLSTINDKQFQKHPSTYLNNECWNDEIFPMNAPTQTQKKPPLDYR
jgi:hypothetical protein